MSITCSCLVLFILCLSSHALDARRDLIGSVDRYKKSQQNPHLFSNKGHEDHSNPGLTSEISIPKEKSGDQINTTVKRKDQKTRTNFDSKVGSESRKGKGITEDAKYHRTKKPQDSVSWRVPHKQRGVKQPGFNLDYSPPKTHPPSHN